jgi:Branched-chain amino acid transport system / permease component
VLAAGVRLAVPMLLAALGEIVTERAGVLNLGLEGIMLAGALAGFMVTGWAEHALPGTTAGIAPWLGLGAGLLAGLVMGVLSVSLRTDQVVPGIMLVALGHGCTTYVYREAFGSLAARITPMGSAPVPGLAELPVVGPVLFAQDPATYLSLVILAGVWFLLFRTTWGLAMSKDVRAGTGCRGHRRRSSHRRRSPGESGRRRSGRTSASGPRPQARNRRAASTCPRGRRKPPSSGAPRLSSHRRRRWRRSGASPAV